MSSFPRRTQALTHHPQRASSRGLCALRGHGRDAAAAPRPSRTGPALDAAGAPAACARGHGDTDLATTYKFDDDQYLFTFREFIIPVASVFFYNMKQLRSTGKFLGVTSSGEIESNSAGAFIQKASMTFYPEDAQPV